MGSHCDWPRTARADGLRRRMPRPVGRNIKPYAAQVKNGRKLVHLGRFATAEEAALCVARSPEGQALRAEAYLKAAAAAEQERKAAVDDGEEGTGERPKKKAR